MKEELHSKEELLLREVASIEKKYDLFYQKTGGYFNIFEIADIAADEVRTCRILHELLSPKGRHCQGHMYLKLFIRNVLKMHSIADEELRTASVWREFVIDQSRRIDIVIETANRFIPIEVKIYAMDQENQIQDYYEYAKNTPKNRAQAEETRIFYLTPFGKAPSGYSLGNLAEERVTNISFAKDILGWLTACLTQSETVRIAPIREVLQQFSAAIRRFTNQMEDDETMEIKDLLMQSSENMKSAIAIMNSVNDCKTEVLNRMLGRIEKNIPTEKLHNEYDYCAPYKGYPGISYFYKNVRPGVDIWLRFENWGNIGIGFCVAENGKDPGKQLLEKEEIRKYLPVEPKTDRWWIYWEHLLGDNNTWPDLLEPANSEEFLKKCADRFNELRNW